MRKKLKLLQVFLLAGCMMIGTWTADFAYAATAGVTDVLEATLSEKQTGTEATAEQGTVEDESKTTAEQEMSEDVEGEAETTGSETDEDYQTLLKSYTSLYEKYMAMKSKDEMIMIGLIIACAVLLIIISLLVLKLKDASYVNEEDDSEYDEECEEDDSDYDEDDEETNDDEYDEEYEETDDEDYDEEYEDEKLNFDEDDEKLCAKDVGTVPEADEKHVYEFEEDEEGDENVEHLDDFFKDFEVSVSFEESDKKSEESEIDEKDDRNVMEHTKHKKWFGKNDAQTDDEDDENVDEDDENADDNIDDADDNADDDGELEIIDLNDL